MAYQLRGRRVAYDNVAAGAVAGYENHVGTEGASDTSPMGNVNETGGISNIANAALPGIEDTENSVGDKLTCDHETVAD